MIKLDGVEIKPTLFPDGTQQVWKVPEELFKGKTGPNKIVDWRYESDTELMTITQLAYLFQNYNLELFVPYLPYARQDKKISNETTFGLHPFMVLLRCSFFDQIVVFDVHNWEYFQNDYDPLRNISPEKIHLNLIREIMPQNIVFPDLGAAKRYPWLRNQGINCVTFEKHREQSTGRILGSRIADGKMEIGRTIIFDDICDGGATFLSVKAEIDRLVKEGQIPSADVHLFVSHGLFSKGRQLLEDAGLFLHTTNSLPRNQDGIKI